MIMLASQVMTGLYVNLITKEVLDHRSAAKVDQQLWRFKRAGELVYMQAGEFFNSMRFNLFYFWQCFNPREPRSLPSPLPVDLIGRHVTKKM